MTRWIKTGAILAALAGIAAEPASAARITLSRQSRVVSEPEVAGGAPMGALVHEFFVTTDSDLLTIAVDVDVPVYRHPLASQRTAPEPDVVAANPAAAVSSFITTPGDTLMLGGGFDGPGPDRGWGDLTNDGPQQNFRFAQLTVGQTGTFSGRIDLRGYSDPDLVQYGFTSLPFSFSLPGSLGELGLIGSEPSYSLEYSLDPPPAPEPAPIEPTPTPPIIIDPTPITPEPPGIPPIVETPTPLPVETPKHIDPVVPVDWLDEEWWNWQGREPFIINETFELGQIIEITPGVVMIKALPDGGAAIVDLGANIDVAWDGVSPMLFGVTGLSESAMLTSFAAYDGDASQLATGRAAFLAANIAGFVATSSDAGTQIPEPATASLMAIISLLPVAGACRSRRNVRRGRGLCP